MLPTQLGIPAGIENADVLIVQGFCRGIGAACSLRGDS